VCNDGNPCTDNYCLEGNQTIPGDCNFTFFGNYTCANCFNPNIPGCVPGGLGPGQIVGIAVGAAAAAAIAITVAAWGRSGGAPAPGAAGAGQTPVANTSPIYRDPVNAGVMPEGLN